MTPAEHYAEAERCLSAANEQMKVLQVSLDEFATSPPALQAAVATIQVSIAVAQVHATLAATTVLPQPPTMAGMR